LDKKMARDAGHFLVRLIGAYKSVSIFCLRPALAGLNLPMKPAG
jgi:hypothetical protein